MTRFQMAEMTPAGAARFIRNIAQTTASNSENWENFQQIVESMIVSAMDAGRAYGRRERVEEPEAITPHAVAHLALTRKTDAH